MKYRPEQLAERVVEAHAQATRRDWGANDHRLFTIALNALGSLAQTCGDCQHWNEDDGSVAGVGYCTNPVSWHKARPMPAGEGCTKWSSRDE